MSIPAPASNDIMESVIVKGDLSKLTPEERVKYYSEVCHSLGLNPLTKPFEYITLNGKLTLYALRTCADQLRKINGVSLEIVSREVVNDILTVHVRAKLPDGRADEDLGAVYFPDSLKGEARANAELKAVTKAKRRATLSICGLGWLDETEISATKNGAGIYDDGNGAGEPTAYLTAEQQATLRKILTDKGRADDIERFCGIYQAATLANIPAGRYSDALAKASNAAPRQKETTP